MAQIATTDQKNAMRRKGQTSDLYVAIFDPRVIFSAVLDTLPTTTDMIAQISYVSGVGDYTKVKADMTLWVGTTTGAYDLGMIRIRKAATATLLYIGEQSKIDWQSGCKLTVVDDFDLKAKHIHIDSAGVPLMDYDIAYSDQHTVFNPVPVLGPIVRVKKLTGANVTVQLGPEQGYTSYVIGSTISSYLWSCETATFDSTGAAKPIATFTTTGWHTVYCAVTAANGKTKEGVRYVYIWSDANPPYKLSDVSMDESQDAGGGNFSVSFPANADIADIPDRALCVLFSADRYDSYLTGTLDNVGVMPDAQNIEYIGRIMGESIRYDAMRSEVSFDVQGFNEWFKKIPGFPSGLELATNTPAAWTDMPSLNVDRAAWHFLEWRCTATRMMDVILTGDTRYAVELSSLNNNLWAQLEEFAYMTIFAFPAVDMFGRFFLQIEPQLIPEASRTAVKVMDLEKYDFYGEVNIDRTIVPEISQVDFSGISVDVSGSASSLFSLAPGHIPDDYGSLEIGDRYLLPDQASANALAGLIRAWKNDPYKPIALNLLNNKMISCIPNQYAGFTLSASDTIRGIGYSGRLIPVRRSLNFNPQTGFKSYSVDFEAEVFEGVVVDGDIPGSDTDPSIQPLPSFPPLPALPVFFPGLPSATPDGPPVVLLVDKNKGILRSDNFNAPTPQWSFWNAGIPSSEQAWIVSGTTGVTPLLRTPNGAYYVLVSSSTSPFGVKIYRASALGGTFTEIVNTEWMNAVSGGYAGNIMLLGMGYNPNKPEEIAFVLASDAHYTASVWVGNYLGWTKGAEFSRGNFFSNARFVGTITFGGGKWVWDRLGDAQFYFVVFSADGSTLENTSPILSNTTGHARAGTSAVIVKPSGDEPNDFMRTTDNTYTLIDIDTAGPVGGFGANVAIAPDGNYMMGNWDIAGAGGQRGKSSDGGYTWSGLPSLPFGGQYCFGYAGGSGTASRWIAARGVVRYSPDFGTTWQNKEGNINYLIPVSMSIRKILIPGFDNG